MTHQMVDWDMAVKTAKRLMRPGPEVTPAQAHQVVADLKKFASEAEDHVRGYTGLTAAPGSAPLLVVDRLGWVKANTESFQVVLTPLIDKFQARREPKDDGAGAGALGAASGMADAVGPRLTGIEAGALLSFLSTKILGQFDPFWPGAAADSAESGDVPAPVGRLLLVAPNVVAIERELRVEPRDFRMWVCLHEETHRVQFTAVPWLREHVRSEISAFLDATEVDPAVLGGRIRDVIESLVDSFRNSSGGDGEGVAKASLLDIVQTPQQREVMDRLTAVMSLLEGHADVVMDGVGPSVVPSVAVIRERFQRRREHAKSADRVLRRLLGLDAKMRQYRDGAGFVRGVIAQVGMDGFNRVWTSPETLPSKAEIADPAAWVRRVLPRAVAS